MSYINAVATICQTIGGIPGVPEPSSEIINFDNAPRPSAFLLDDEEDLDAVDLMKTVYTESRASLTLWLLYETLTELRRAVQDVKDALRAQNVARPGFWVFVRRVEYKYSVEGNAYVAADLTLFLGSYEDNP